MQDTVWVSCKHAAVATTDADRQVGGTSSTCFAQVGLKCVEDEELSISRPRDQ